MGIVPIAIELGVNQDLVIAIMRRKKLRQNKGRPWSGPDRKVKRDPRATEMLKLKRSGMTLAEIGAEFGLSRERVRQILWNVGYHSNAEKRDKWISRVQALHSQGQTTREISETTGLSRNVVLRYLQIMGKKPHQKSWAKVSIQILIDTYQQTKSTIETATLLGMTQGNVWRRLKNAGIQMNGKDGSPEAVYKTSEGLLTVKEIAERTRLTLKSARNRIYEREWDEGRLLEPKHEKHEKRGGKRNVRQQ